MGRKDLVPRGTTLWCVFEAVSAPPFIFQGPFYEVDGDMAVIAEPGRVTVFTFPLHRCFFTKEGAERYIRDVLGGGRV